MPPRILVLGAGAVGLTVAAKLSGVAEVHAVCRPRHADAIAGRGFLLSGIWGEGIFRYAAWTAVPRGLDFDYCFITCKGPDTRALCVSFAETLKGATAVSLQNGIGNEEVLADFAALVIGGTVITGFEWRGDAAVHVSVEAGPIILGRFPGGSDPKVKALVELFRQAGLNVEETPEIRSALWAKTFYNCALNPLGAIIGVPYGALAHPAAWAIIEKVVAEAHAVCVAEGVTPPWLSASDYLAHLRGRQLPLTARHRSSMLQDIEAGRRTEIDVINGAVVALGRRHGIPTPVNATLADLIRFKEHLGRPGAAESR